MIEKLDTLVKNIENKKANRCTIPSSNISIYDGVNNHQLIGGLNIEFDGQTVPVNDIDLVIEDNTLGISIIASYNAGNEYIKIVGLEASEIFILENGVWNPILNYELPEEFRYNHVEGLEEQKDLAESIICTVLEHEETICSLSRKVYGGTTGSAASIGFTNIWVDGTNGDDNNDGFQKTDSIKTVNKALTILNNASTGDKLIRVHIAPVIIL